jgi:mRNA interferase RelE/StbE
MEHDLAARQRAKACGESIPQRSTDGRTWDPAERAKFRVRFESHAERQVRRLPPSVREPVIRAYALADDPRPPGVRKTRGFESQYRIRVGNYRVSYEIYDNVLLVLAMQAGIRREVYRSLLRRPARSMPR